MGVTESNTLLFLLLLGAVAIGWLLGYRARKAVVSSPSQEHHQEASKSRPAFPAVEYLESLPGFDSDRSFDRLMESLEVSVETYDSCMALAGALRRRGEVDRAIKVHHRLLVDNALLSHQRWGAQLELARDYISAGLLDRAELLLNELQALEPVREKALRLLLSLYQDEREWQKAIDIALRLLPRRSLLWRSSGEGDRELEAALAHYHCELSQKARQRGDFKEARRSLRYALARQKDHIRALLLQTDLDAQEGNERHLLKGLELIEQRAPRLLPEALPILLRSASAISDHELERMLARWYQLESSTSILIAQAEIRGRLQGVEAAAALLSAAMKKRPTLRGLLALLDLHLSVSQGRAKENLGLLQRLLTQMVAEKPVYICSHCGFSGKHLHWLCPGCKRWGSLQRIKGPEGD